MLEYQLINVMPVSFARAFVHHSVPSARRHRDGERQLLVDISVIAHDDAHTGIQRVVRALLGQLVHCPPTGYRVRPVIATRKDKYRYSPGFEGWSPGDKDRNTGVHVGPGDIFLGLDLAAHLLPLHHAELIEWKRKGATLHFLVYDLLPVQNPHWFNTKTPKNIRRWLRTLAILSDNIICISNVVKNDLAGWMEACYGLQPEALEINTIPLGGDIAASLPSRGLPSNAEQLLAELRKRPTVLMVGTLEPRKGHAQVLDAFEQLWRQARDVNLVFVGKPGWKTRELEHRLVAHCRRQCRLYWLEDVTDEMLELLYSAASGVIVASEAEGFGLSLVEAAHHNKPILARDIPVFREIGGDGVTYFNGDTHEALAQDIDDWLGRIAKGEIPSIPPPLRTWQDSCRHLLACMGLSNGE
jgi:glycosyltransferase involved in cell wall biosynthesis